MRAWVETDPAGVEVLVRAGTGLVTAVAPFDVDALRVEIECDLPSSWARALRYTVEVTLPRDHPLTDVALAAEIEQAPVRWAATWHRHEGVPGHLPIGSLDLATDAHATLTDLAVTTSPIGVASADLASVDRTSINRSGR